MFKSFTPFKHTGLVLSDAQRTGFTPCAPSQAQSIGSVPHSNGALVVAGVELFTIERKMVPTDMVKREAAKACDKIEAETGRRPKGKHLKEVKEGIEHELLAKAFPKRKTVPVLWLDSYVLVGSTTAADVDSLVTILVSGQQGLKIEPLRTAASVDESMSRWACEPGSADTPFIVGREVTVATAGAGRASFKDMSVEDPEVVQALREPNLVTSLALCNRDETSFVLTEALQVKSLKVGASAGNDHADAAAAECHLYRGELSRLMGELVEALGGEARDAA